MKEGSRRQTVGSKQIRLTLIAGGLIYCDQFFPCLLSAVYCLLLTAYCLLLTAYCLPSGVCFLM